MDRLSHLVAIPPPKDKRQYRPTNPDRRRYITHKANAKQRGIAFEIEFDDWLQWWKDTGHYHERGNKRGQYVMGRIGDVGPYKLGNIVCIQAQENSVAPHAGKPKSAEWKRKLRKTRTKKRLDEVAAILKRIG